MKFPKTIEKFLGDRAYVVDEIGKSKAQVICYDDMVLKIQEDCAEADNEYRMMEWLSDRLMVPKVICYEKEKGLSYLLMSKIQGEMSCSSAMMEHPNLLVKALAEGLRMLMAMDIKHCPTNNYLDKKLEQAEYRVLHGLCDMEDAEPETYGEYGFKNPKDLLQWLKENKPEEELVFSHGDYCLPNIFIQDNKISGFIDLGRSGIADKYQDIALCYRSLKHNYDGAYGGRVRKDFNPDILFDKLKIVPNWDKIKYYILLDELF